jgi:hypothetical protein
LDILNETSAFEDVHGYSGNCIQTI